MTICNHCYIRSNKKSKNTQKTKRQPEVPPGCRHHPPPYAGPPLRSQHRGKVAVTRPLSQFKQCLGKLPTLPVNLLYSSTAFKDKRLLLYHQNRPMLVLIECPSSCTLHHFQFFRRCVLLYAFANLLTIPHHFPQVAAITRPVAKSRLPALHPGPSARCTHQSRH